MPVAPKKTVRYTLEQKKKAIEMVRAGQSISDVAKKQGIQNRKTLENWVRLQDSGQLDKPKGVVLHPIQQALLAKETLKVDYVPPGKSRRTHILNPLGLVQCGAITYLIATFSRKTEPIVRLPLHRVKSAERTHDRGRYLVPEGFTLHGFIDQGGMGFNEKGPVKIRAWVSEMLGPRLEEVKLSRDQKLRPVEGGFELTATLIDSWRLHWWILSKTGDIEVLEPKDLRDDIARTLRDGATRYGRHP